MCFIDKKKELDSKRGPHPGSGSLCGPPQPMLSMGKIIVDLTYYLSQRWALTIFIVGTFYVSLKCYPSKPYQLS